MDLWLISQNVNTNYDTYDAAVVAALTEDDARMIIPDSNRSWHGYGYNGAAGVWATSPDQVTVKHIGEAALGTEPGVILASFNAG